MNYCYVSELQSEEKMEVSNSLEIRKMSFIQNCFIYSIFLVYYYYKNYNCEVVRSIDVEIGFNSIPDQIH